MKGTSRILVGLMFFAASSRGIAETTVTGIVVNQIGKPIEGVACLLAGTPFQAPGTRVIYSGISVPIFSDKEGKFSISLPEGSLGDLQFDASDYAPVFLYRVGPEVSPLRVVMTEGKVLRGRFVDGQGVPIAHVVIELQMAQEDRWYQRKGITDNNGEFLFRLSEPPQKSPWVIYYVGKQFEIDHSKVKSGILFEVVADVPKRVSP